MFPRFLMLATASAKSLGFVIGSDLQTGILPMLGALLLLVGTLLRYKFPLKQEDYKTTPYAFAVRSAQSAGYISSTTAAAPGTSFNFATTPDRQSDRRPVAYLPIQRRPTTERHASLV